MNETAVAPAATHTRRQRLAVCTAAALTTVVAMQHHVHVVLNDPSTWTLPLHHKCGQAALAGLAWMFVELVRLAAGSWQGSLVPAPSEASL